MNKSMAKYLTMKIINWKTIKKYKILITAKHFQQISIKRIMLNKNIRIK